MLVLEYVEGPPVISMAQDGTCKRLSHPVAQRLFADMMQASPQRNLYLVSKRTQPLYSSSARTLPERWAREPSPFAAAAVAVHVSLSAFDRCMCAPQVVADMHAADVWHGDLKPANMLLSGCDGVKLVDFGSAQHLGGRAGAAASSSSTSPSALHLRRGLHTDTSAFETADSSVSTRQTDHSTPPAPPTIARTPAQPPASPSGEIRRTLGTPAFMSPEACSGQPFNSAAADCWALGVCLYLAVLGRLPFRAPSVLQLYQVIRCVPQPPQPAAPVAALLHEHGLADSIGSRWVLCFFHTALTTADVPGICGEVYPLMHADQAKLRSRTIPAYPTISAAC